MKRMAIGVLSAVLMFSGMLWGATLRVPSQYAGIQQAVYWAANGDSILVGPGIYSGFQINQKHNICVTSEIGKESTVIENNGPYAIEIIQSDSICINAFTIKNAGINVWVYLSDAVVVSNCNIINSTDPTGAGIMTFQSHNALILGNYIDANRGWGVACAYGSATVQSNVVSNSGRGGIYFSGENAPLCFSNTVVENGEAGIITENLNGSSSIFQNIIAYNGAEDVWFRNEIPHIFECNCIWGNYKPGLHSPENIYVDPLFCNPDVGDFSLEAESPALNAACGLMGAIPIAGCAPEIAVQEVTWGAIKALYR